MLNGALNFSILDGWWAEAYDGTNGFAIGIGQTHAVPSVQDERDHKALIETLTNQVVPLYYDRDAIGPAPRLDRPPEERVPDPGLAVQRRPHGDGLRPAQLPAGGRRPVVRDAQGLTPARPRRSLRLHRARAAGLGCLGSRIEPRRIVIRRGSSRRTRLLVATMSQGFIGEKLGSFRLEAILGSGAMGVVTGRPHETTGRPAAVKVVHGEIAQKGKVFERFEREAEILKQFRHPNIVRLLAWGRFKGTSYFAMEYVEGATLEKILQDRGELPWREVVELGDPALRRPPLRPRAGRRPPRPQAVEPDGHRRRPAQADRLRDRQGPRRDRR